MNKFLILLVLLVIIIMSIGFYLLSQREENFILQNKNDSQNIIDSNQQFLKSKSASQKNNTLEPENPSENYDDVSQTIKSESASTTSTSAATTPPLNPLEKHNQKQRSQAPDLNQKKTETELAANQNDKISPKKISHLLPEEDLSEKLYLTFVFLNEDNSAKTNRVKVTIPIRTHTGFINEYSYSAKLEKEQFSITWEIPNWFQNTNYSQPDKGITLTHNSLIILNISAVDRIYIIKLNNKLPIELTFETPDSNLIPDGTKFKFFEKPYFVEIYSPYLLNQKGVIYIEPGKVLEIKPLSIGQYFADSFFVDSKNGLELTRTIQLKKKIFFTAVLFDQKKLPLNDHFVIFSKSYHPNGITEILADYEKTGNIDKSKIEEIYKTNSIGEVLGEANTPGEYFAIIFGPKIKGSIKKEIMLPAEGEKLNIQIDVSIAEIKLNFLENGKLYTNELNGFYRNNFTSGYFNIKTGSLTLSKLQAGKLELHLKNDVFVNTTIQLIVPETGTIEQNIELKIGATISGTLTANNKPILGKNLSIYLYEKGNASFDHNTQTDLNGHFQFKGLNPEVTYIFHIDLSNYKIDPEAPKEFRAGENEVFINVIEKYDFATLVYDELGKPIMIHNVSKSITRNDKIVYDAYLNIEKNKFTIGLELGDKISFCILAKEYASHYQTIVFEASHLSNPLVINLKKGFLVKGVAFDTMNKPIFSGIIVEAAIFHFGNFKSNIVDVHRQERTALGEGGTFQIENAQVGEKFYLLSKDNSPIPFTIEEKNRSELIELKATRSYSFSGNLRSQKNVLQEGRRVMGERIESNEHVETYVDAKGNFYLNCLRPGKWVFTSNFRDMYKVVPRIEIEITDKDETYDWVVFR